MRHKVLAFGEILWDIINNEPHIGGAPFNLAAHLAKTGVDSYVVSSLGNDKLGKAAFKKVENLKIKEDFVLIQDDYPTGTVDVELDSNGIPTYTINENTAWDNIFLTQAQKKHISEIEWDLFCLGTLAQRTEKNRKLLSDISGKIKAKDVFYDINLRQNYYDKSWIKDSLKTATIVKVNDEEADFLSEYFYGKKLSEKEFAGKIILDYELKLVCVTRGADGAAVYHDGEIYENPGIKVKVGDTVGAGDSFSAGLIFSLLNGQTPEKALDFAIKIGAFVASSFGAIPNYSKALEEEISRIKSENVQNHIVHNLG